ncbi:MAG TPA: hypothetical protein HPP77_03925 [Candidatus Hydrogenedentes bacterium]|nr:hypothetical protein [Candidatus Hydrogenedentota bacterium]HIJ73071.1 hypothetical protein [Candidatus Hydrogenedentota bacterium]
MICYLIDLRPMWRAFLAVILSSFVGGTVGLVISFHYYWLENMMLGAATAMPVGFLLGTLWHFASFECRDARSVMVIVFLGFMCICLGVVAVGFELPRIKSEMAALSALKQLDPAFAKQIVVFDKYGEDKIKEIRSPETIAAFAAALADSVGHSPNHPHYSHSWYVVAEGDRQRLESEFHFNPKFPNSVIGDFVSKSGNTTACGGTFRSENLRSWFEANIE